MAIPALLTKWGGIQTNHVNSKEHICTRHGNGKSPTNEGLKRKITDFTVHFPLPCIITGGYAVETSVFQGKKTQGFSPRCPEKHTQLPQVQRAVSRRRKRSVRSFKERDGLFSDPLLGGENM